MVDGANDAGDEEFADLDANTDLGVEEGALGEEESRTSLSVLVADVRSAMPGLRHQEGSLEITMRAAMTESSSSNQTLTSEE